MAPYSSVLAWETPWAEESGGQQSMVPQGVGQHWATEDMHIHTQWLQVVVYNWKTETIENFLKITLFISFFLKIVMMINLGFHILWIFFLMQSLIGFEIFLLILDILVLL